MPDRDASHQPALSRLPPAQRRVAESLARRWRESGEELYLVGGIVRDGLLDRPVPVDLDFTTSTLPEQTHHLALAAGAESIFTIGERFGTIGAVFAEAAGQVVAEITTFRDEHYVDDSRFPAVRFGIGLIDDLARRDFTANAIAVDPLTGQIVDPFGGEADIALGVLRAVGNADARFEEDPLRLLRAARFVAQLGFRLEPETAAAMARCAGSLNRISIERVYGELNRLLVGDWADHGLEVLRESGLLAVALPELSPLAAEGGGAGQSQISREKDLWKHSLRVLSQSPPRLAVRWAALLHDAAKPFVRGIDEHGEVHFFGHERVGAGLARKLLRRLKADRATLERVALLVELHGRPAAYESDWTDSAVRRLALEAGDGWDDLLDLAAADVTSGREHKRRLAAARVAALRAHDARLRAEADIARLQSPLDGDELMAMFDRGPGIWIKHLKDHLRELVIDGELAVGDKDEAEAIAHRWISAQADLP